jgi:hypothetical protein
MRMKLNKKFVAINVLASLLFMESAMAGAIQGVRTPAEKDGSADASKKPGTTTEVKTSTSTAEEVSHVKAVSDGECSGDQNKAKYFPQQLFSELTRDGDGLSIELKPNNKVSVKIPPIINVCGKFVPELKQDKVSKNVSVLMTLVGTKTEKVWVDNVEQVKVTKVPLSYKEFEDCLKEQKILVGGKINHDKISGDKYTSSAYLMDYDFDKKKDQQKSISLSFAYPREYEDKKIGYDALYKFDDSVSVPGEACMRAETIGKERMLINKGREDLISEINAICLRGDAQEIADARNTLGNADALKDIAEKIKAEMDVGYLAAVKKDVEQIYKNLSSIEDKVLRDKDSMNEKKAKELVGEYAENLKKLDSIFLEKAITRIDILMQKREKMKDDSPEAKAADAEIKTLNAQIGEFSKRGAGLTYLYDVMEKYATNESAKVIEDIYLKSRLYSQVYSGDADGRPKALSFEDAQKKQTEGMKKFDKVLDEWSDVYLVGKGNQYPAIKTQREAQAIATRMNTRLATFQKKEMEDYNSYCTAGMTGGMRNPTKCREFISGKPKREAAQYKKRETDLRSIAGKERKLSKMTAAYSEYDMKRNAMKEKEEYERYDSSSISGYEDDFSERFPGFSGSVSTAYDPSMYSMNGMSGMAPNPFMAQQQQMQFQQSPQIQQGGWPSMR